MGTLQENVVDEKRGSSVQSEVDNLTRHYLRSCMPLIVYHPPSAIPFLAHMLPVFVCSKESTLWSDHTHISHNSLSVSLSPIVYLRLPPSPFGHIGNENQTGESYMAYQ